MNIDATTVRRKMDLRLMSQKDLADAAGVSGSTVSSALAKGTCSPETTRKLANALGVDPGKLVQTD